MDECQVVVITGLSGAGRSTAANALEDAGFFCVDNMPTALLPAFAELCATNISTLGNVALVIDTREREFFEAAPVHLEALKSDSMDYEILYLDASTEAIMQRFSESRRRHPLAEAADDLRGAVEAEREHLEPLRRQAGFVLDTSTLNVHDLGVRVRERYASRNRSMQIQVLSFGFKHGVPTECDLVFDARFLPNPYYDPELRPLTGLDSAVREVVLGADRAKEFLARLMDLLTFLVPEYAREGKSYLTIGVGCTGGRHRSVALATSLGEQLSGAGEHRVLVQHRDLRHVERV